MHAVVRSPGWQRGKIGSPPGDMRPDGASSRGVRSSSRAPRTDEGHVGLTATASPGVGWRRRAAACLTSPAGARLLLGIVYAVVSARGALVLKSLIWDEVVYAS